MLTGKGRYADGLLYVAVKDPGGDFTLVVDEATFDGEMIAVGERLTIRLNSAEH